MEKKRDFKLWKKPENMVFFLTNLTGCVNIDKPHITGFKRIFPPDNSEIIEKAGP